MSDTVVGENHVGMLDGKANHYKMFNSFCMRVKPAGDLDASASDISIQEMDVSYEYWDYVPTRG
jgi:hypothetical protein